MPDPNRPSLSTVRARRSPLRLPAAETRKQPKTMGGRTIHSRFDSIRQRLRFFRSACPCNSLSACSFPLFQAPWSAAHDFALGRYLRLSQCITYTLDVVAIFGSELLPIHPHFFNDWIITHHLHRCSSPTEIPQFLVRFIFVISFINS